MDALAEGSASHASMRGEAHRVKEAVPVIVSYSATMIFRLALLIRRPCAVAF